MTRNELGVWLIAMAVAAALGLGLRFAAAEEMADAEQSAAPADLCADVQPWRVVEHNLNTGITTERLLVCQVVDGRAVLR